MTRIVVLDQELHEALPVVDVPASFMRDLRSGAYRRWHVPIWPQIAVHIGPVSERAEAIEMKIVTLRFESVCRGSRGEHLFWYAYADDPELALQMRAAFLPGQLGEVQRREREAYFRGMFSRMFG